MRKDYICFSFGNNLEYREDVLIKNTIFTTKVTKSTKEEKYEKQQEKMDPASTDCSGPGNPGGKCAGRLQDQQAYRFCSHG
jgi:hypothetical protein